MNGSDANQDAIQWEEARRWFRRADEDLSAARLLLQLGCSVGDIKVAFPSASEREIEEAIAWAQR
jgi:hypothetical protein